jgi:hypothetical protein
MRIMAVEDKKPTHPHNEAYSVKIIMNVENCHTALFQNVVDSIRIMAVEDEHPPGSHNGVYLRERLPLIPFKMRRLGENCTIASKVTQARRKQLQ